MNKIFIGVGVFATNSLAVLFGASHFNKMVRYMLLLTMVKSFIRSIALIVMTRMEVDY